MCVLYVSFGSKVRPRTQYVVKKNYVDSVYCVCWSVWWSERKRTLCLPRIVSSQLSGSW